MEKLKEAFDSLLQSMYTVEYNQVEIDEITNYINSKTRKNTLESKSKFKIDDEVIYEKNYMSFDTNAFKGSLKITSINTHDMKNFDKYWVYTLENKRHYFESELKLKDEA